MTREEILYSMRMVDLVGVADKLGIKINRKSAKSEAIEKILVAEEMNKQNEKELIAEEKSYVEAEVNVDTKEPELVPMPGTEDPDWGEKHYKSNTIDEAVFVKFVKKAQRLITAASHDDTGYHVTISYDGKTKSYDDKNLQNIRSAIGHIYRGEVTI